MSFLYNKYRALLTIRTNYLNITFFLRISQKVVSIYTECISRAIARLASYERHALSFSRQACKLSSMSSKSSYIVWVSWPCINQVCGEV